MVYTFKITILDGYWYDGEPVERVIAMRDSSTLEDFIWAILDSIDFDFDHMYEFTVGRKSYTGAPPFAEDNERCLKKISSLGLRKNSKLHLVYDFGDYWEFGIVVTDISGKDDAVCGLLSSAGTVEQYPDYDEDEDYDDDDDGGTGAFFGGIEGSPFDDDDDAYAFGAYDDCEDGDYFGEEVPDEDWGYRPSEELLECAFRFKKAKPWERMAADDWFAVRFSDGETGYISVMGHGGDHYALGVYVGDEALQTLRLLTSGVSDDANANRLKVLKQDCLQMVFDSKQYLRPEEVETVHDYTRRHGIRLGGANAFPHFLQYKPYTMPWYPDSEKEERYMMEAAEAAMYLRDYLNDHIPYELGFMMYFPGGKKEVPLLVREGDSYAVSGMLDLPQPKEDSENARPSAIPAGAVEVLKAIKQRGTLQAAVVTLPDPVQTAPATRPFFPCTLFMVDKKTGAIMYTEFADEPGFDPDLILEQFAVKLIEAEYHPTRIEVKENGTFALLEEFSKAIGSKLVKVSDLKKLDAASNEVFVNRMSPEEQFNEIMDMMEEILNMDDSAVSELPAFMKAEILTLADSGLLPQRISKELKRKLGK